MKAELNELPSLQMLIHSFIEHLEVLIHYHEARAAKFRLQDLEVEQAYCLGAAGACEALRTFLSENYNQPKPKELQ